MSNNIKDIEDVDDDTFISKQPKNYIFAETKKAADINERTSRMLLNSRTIVQETESIGQSTLENLSAQRETLERVEDDLDNINSMTRSTQKHLNNMRSFFGGIKSLFSNSNSTNTQPPAIVANSRGVPKSATIAQISSSTTNNASNISTSSSSTNPNNSALNQQRNSAVYPSQVIIDKRDKPDDEFEANLSEIGFGLGRLKEMAMKLGDEIGDQNEMLDRITDKSERAGDSIKHQSRQMQQLLKKG